MATKKLLDSKTQRLEARVTSEFKEQLMLACSLTGKSVTDFVVEHLSFAAEEVIFEHSQWRLEQRDSEAFMEAILNPKTPGPRLTEAAKHFSQSSENCRYLDFKPAPREKTQ